MKTKRTVSLLLCAAVILGLLSCAGETGKTAEKTSPDTFSATDEEAGKTTEYYKADVPVKDFDGHEFRFLTNDHNSLTWAYTTMDVESPDGEPINDAVYTRNRSTEETYNVKIVDIMQPFGGVNGAAMKSIKAGADDYDIVIEDVRHTANLITERYVTDITQIPHIDTQNPWWDSNVGGDLSVCGYTFFLGGDYTLAHYDTTCVLVFNKNLAVDNNIGDPYDFVLEGKWTLDEFDRMMKKVSKDLDGNGTFDENDLYGFTSLSFVFYPSFMTGAGALTVSKDSDDYPVYTLGSEHNTTVFERLLSIMHQENLVYDVIPLGKDHRLPEYMFAADQALFWAQLIYWTTQLRDMKSDFGIIPFPKFDEKQTDYEVMMFGSPLSMVPVTNSDLERTGILLEYMAAYSRNELIPAYYDITMKEKVSRDETTKQILDIIFGNRCYTLAHAYFASIEDGVTRLFEQNKNTFASYAEKSAKTAEKLIEKFVDSLQ